MASGAGMNKDYFVPRMFYKMLIPSVISSIGFAFSDMADALVVGQRMGEDGLAAISLCLPVFMLMNIIMYAFGTGGGVKFSGQLGANNEKGAVQCFNRILRVSLVFGVIFAAVANIFAPQVLAVLGAGAKGTPLYGACETYMRIISLGAPFMILNIVLSDFLRNDNNEVIAARGFIIGNITDLLLNVVLVLIFNFGTAGAAVSTVIGSTVAIICYLPAITGKKANVIKIERTDADIKQVVSCFRTGFSTSVQNLFQFIFLLVVNRIMLSLGGGIYVAIFDVIYNASLVIIYLCEGTSEAAQPLVSAFAGEQSEEDCRQIRRLSIISSLIFGGIAAALIFIFAKYVAYAFGISNAALNDAVYAIRIYCLGAAFVAMNIILSRYCQAKEDNRSAFISVLLKSLVVAVPCVFLFSLLGAKFIWFNFPMSEAVSFFLFMLYYRAAEKKRARFDENRIYRVTVSGQENEISELLDGCGEFCDKWNAKTNQKYYVMLIIEEIVASIMRNALVNVSDGKIRITLIAAEDGDFTLHVLDNAVEFNPLSLHSKKKTDTADFDIDEVSILLIKKKVKKYLYRQCNGFNSLSVRI